MQHQKIIRPFLYYDCAIDNIVIMALKLTTVQQNKGAEQTNKKLMHFLKYCAMKPKEGIY